MFKQSEINRFIRIFFVAVAIIMISVAVFAIFYEEQPLSGTAALLAGLVALLLAPPFMSSIDRAFTPTSNSAEAVRLKLKEIWIDKYLRQEEQAIKGASNYNLDTISEYECDLVTQFERFFIDSTFKGCSSPKIRSSKDENTFFFGSKKLKVNDEDTILSIFSDLTLIVHDDQNSTGEFIVLMGERGTRKTVQLLKLAEHLVDRDMRVPVYANLFSWAAGCKSIDVWLAEEIQRQYDVLGWQARRLMRTDYLILLLDGFEEIPHERRRHFIKALEDFLQKRIAVPIISGPSQSAEPVDLRDAVVIASTTPHSWAKEEVKSFLSWDTVYEENEQDLDEHIAQLIDMLENLGMEGSRAPVVTVRIRPLTEDQAESYLACHFRRKIIYSDIIYEDLRIEPGALTAATFNQWVPMNPQRVFELKRRKYKIKKLDLDIDKKVKELISELHESENLFLLIQHNPFIMRALISTYDYNFDDKKLISKVNLTPASGKDNDALGKTIISSFVDHSLRSQPSNISPYSATERNDLLQQMAVTMDKQRQHILSERDAAFYLENIGLQAINDSDRHQRPFRGFVAVTSVILFVALYGLYLLVIAATERGLSSDVAAIASPNSIFGLAMEGGLLIAEIDVRLDLARFENEFENGFSASFNETSRWVILILLIIFARNFGWLTCGREDEERLHLKFPARWFLDAGLSAGLFVGLVTGLIFFNVSEIVYSTVNRDPLRYESAVVGLFAFAFFLVIGGLEVGRRYAIVAHAFDGRRFLLFSTVVASFTWSLLFFLFLFWPRSRFEILSIQEIQQVVPLALGYATITGIFVGLLSSLVFSHMYLRHIMLFLYLRINRDMHTPYVQLLDHCAQPQIGLLRRIGGGYLFHHRFIMDYFINKYHEKIPS